MACSSATFNMIGIMQDSDPLADRVYEITKADIYNGNYEDLQIDEISTDKGICDYSYTLECAFGTPPLTWTSGCFGGKIKMEDVSKDPIVQI